MQKHSLSVYRNYAGVFSGGVTPTRGGAAFVMHVLAVGRKNNWRYPVGGKVGVDSQDKSILVALLS